MITLCTVLTDDLQNHIELLLDSIVKRSKLISEVQICKVGTNNDKNWEERNIKFHEFNYSPYDMQFGHPLGLHKCIERTTNEYILFCDPDVFFYTAIEEVFLKLMEKYNINYIGISHHAAIIQAYTFFPCVVNSMVKKSELPSVDWKEGELKYRAGILHAEDLKPDDDYPLANGKYLIASPLPNHFHKFPNKEQKFAPYSFDTSCNLWLWAQEQNWRWLSFQTTDCHIYTTQRFRGNFKINEKLSKQKLIYHAVGGSNNRPEEFQIFTENYKNSIEEEND